MPQQSRPRGDNYCGYGALTQGVLSSNLTPMASDERSPLRNRPFSKWELQSMPFSRFRGLERCLWGQLIQASRHKVRRPAHEQGRAQEDDPRGS